MARADVVIERRDRCSNYAAPITDLMEYIDQSNPQPYPPLNISEYLSPPQNVFNGFIPYAAFICDHT